MTWLIIIAAVLLALFLLVQIRVGVALEYIAQQFVVKVRVGTLAVRVFPGQKKDKPRQKNKKPVSTKKKKNLSRFLPFVPCMLRAAGRVLRQLRVDKLDLSIRVGGQDPADAAVRYGQLNAAVGSVWGLFHTLGNIRDAGIHLDVDFDADRSRAQGILSISWKISQLLSTLLVFVRDTLVIAYQNRAVNKQEGLVT